MSNNANNAKGKGNANANANATPPTPPANATHNATHANDIPSLLSALANAKGNVAEGKRIRRALRAQGYWGGTRARVNDRVRGIARDAERDNNANA